LMEFEIKRDSLRRLSKKPAAAHPIAATCMAASNLKLPQGPFDLAPM
jgi:hypothetical protein